MAAVLIGSRFLSEACKEAGRARYGGEVARAREVFTYENSTIALAEPLLVETLRSGVSAWGRIGRSS